MKQVAFGAHVVGFLYVYRDPTRVQYMYMYCSTSLVQADLAWLYYR